MMFFRAGLLLVLMVIFSVVAQSAVPATTNPVSPMAEAIQRGKLIIVDTKRQLPGNVGNVLNCTSCHLRHGTVAHAMPWVGLTGAFPEYRARRGKVITLQERINDCFQRSMNGKALTPDSADMNAILAYMKSLSMGVPVGGDIVGRRSGGIDTDLVPVPAHGKLIYAQRCASCHGVEGQGSPNLQGGYAVPPLWGKDSFNIGAGMARIYTAAAFVRHNMPLGQGDTLSVQEAVDVAAFFTRQPRPNFVSATKEWPKGGQPKDSR